MSTNIIKSFVVAYAICVNEGTYTLDPKEKGKKKLVPNSYREAVAKYLADLMTKAIEGKETKEGNEE